MDYVKRMGRKTFSAAVTFDDRGDWTITSGAYAATLPMTGPEAEEWVAAGRPAEPVVLAERIASFVGSLASPPKGGTRAKKIKYDTRSWMPLDGEEIVRAVISGQNRSVSGVSTSAVAGVVRCDSPRCSGGKAFWFVIARPGSQYDKVPAYCEGAGRVENMTPEEFAEQHRAWHRETFGVSGRAALNQWIERNKNVAPPELSPEGRAEIDLGLAIARSER